MNSPDEMPGVEGLLYLSDLSPRDKCWDVRKLQTLGIANFYPEEPDNTTKQRITGCAEYLVFALVGVEGLEEQAFRLRSARFCRHRHCVICQWRRQLMWWARFSRKLPWILKDYPNHRFIFLTLTVQNCPLPELRWNLTLMNEAWKRLIKRKEWPAMGFVRSVEVTRSDDNEAHPHFHVLMMVKPGYFAGQEYLSQKRWIEIWRSCLRVEYDPSVRVTAIKMSKALDKQLEKHAHTHGFLIGSGNLQTGGKHGFAAAYAYAKQTNHAHTQDEQNDTHTAMEVSYAHTQDEENDAHTANQVNHAHTQDEENDAHTLNQLSKVIKYILKYVSKPEKLLEDCRKDSDSASDWLVGLTEQLHKTKAITLGGVFKTYLSEHEPENLIHTQEVIDTVEEDADILAKVVWNKEVQRYGI